MKTFTYKDIVSWSPCYEPEGHLSKDWSGTVIDILDNKAIPFPDRLWVIMRSDLVSDKLMRLFAAWCARQVQHLVQDDRSIKAIDASEAFANGLSTKEELCAAWNEAWDAAWDAASDVALGAARDAALGTARDVARDAALSVAWDVARCAAWDAGLDASLDAAQDAACATAWYAACAAAWDAALGTAWDAAWDAQEIKLREMILSGVETGDVK